MSIIAVAPALRQRPALAQPRGRVELAREQPLAAIGGIAAALTGLEQLDGGRGAAELAGHRDQVARAWRRRG